MPAMFAAADAIGTVHYARSTVLSEATLLSLAEFDDELSVLLAALGSSAGTVFDAVFAYVESPRPARSPNTPNRL